MQLKAFRLDRPATLPEALVARMQVGDDGALYAGGTELLLAMKMGFGHWPVLIDLKRIPDLQQIEVTSDRIRIGATATYRAIERAPAVCAALPVLADTARRVANVRVRAAGTLAGALCFAEPHADFPALLIALGAEVRLAGRCGERLVPVVDFITSAYETALASDEIAVTVEVPIPPGGWQVAYRNFKVLERPTVGVAVSAHVEEERFAACPVVVVGAVDEVPRSVPTADLAGEAINASAVIAEITERAVASVDPTEDLSGSVEYKVNLVRVLVRRTLESLVKEDRSCA